MLSQLGACGEEIIWGMLRSLEKSGLILLTVISFALPKLYEMPKEAVDALSVEAFKAKLDLGQPDLVVGNSDHGLAHSSLVAECSQVWSDRLSFCVCLFSENCFVKD